MTDELIQALSLFVAVVVTAAVVNRFAPTARPRLRAIVIMFVLYVVGLATAHVLRVLDQPAWAGRVHIASEVIRVVTIITIAGTIAFRILFRRLGIGLPMIAGDLILGVGYIVAMIGVFSQHGMHPTGALATGAVVSAVLAISLQTTLGNILGGVALQLDGSIHEGDWIQLENGKQGRVRAIRWRHTLVETRDWSTIVVPNAQLLQNNITILGWRDDAAVPQRLWVWFNVDFRYSPQRVIEAVTEALRASPIENVANEPKPNCICMDFSRDGRDSFASYAVRFWVIDLEADEPASSQVRSRVFTALRRAGIPLATPAITNFVEIRDRNREQTHAERNIEARVTALRAVRLFHPLTDQELRGIADSLSPVIYAKNERITKQGAIAHHLYILTRGRVDIITHNPDDPLAESQVVATLDAPEVFGELGVMTGEPRVADVVARTDVECLRLGKPAFERVLTARPEVATEFAELLATRREGFVDAKDRLDGEARKSRHDRERDKILFNIKSFFGL